jgi:hypothetical protein
MIYYRNEFIRRIKSTKPRKSIKKLRRFLREQHTRLAQGQDCNLEFVNNDDSFDNLETTTEMEGEREHEEEIASEVASDSDCDEDDFQADENYNLEVDIELAFIEDGLLEYIQKNHSSLPPTDDTDLGIGKDYTATTAVKRCARYLAFVLTNYPDMIKRGTKSYTSLFRKLIYHRDDKIHEFCKVMRSAHSYTCGTICNIILDLMKGGKWAHFYSKGKSNDHAFTRFSNAISMRRRQWTRLLRRERAKSKNKNSLEELIAKGDIPYNGLKGMQSALEPKIASVFHKVKEMVKNKVISRMFSISDIYFLIYSSQTHSCRFEYRRKSIMNTAVVWSVACISSQHKGGSEE